MGWVWISGWGEVKNTLRCKWRNLFSCLIYLVLYKVLLNFGSQSFFFQTCKLSGIRKCAKKTNWTWHEDRIVSFCLISIMDSYSFPIFGWSSGCIFDVIWSGRYLSDLGLVRSWSRLVLPKLEYKSPILSREATFPTPTLRLYSWLAVSQTIRLSQSLVSLPTLNFEKKKKREWQAVTRDRYSLPHIVTYGWPLL